MARIKPGSSVFKVVIPAQAGIQLLLVLTRPLKRSGLFSDGAHVAPSHAPAGFRAQLAQAGISSKVDRTIFRPRSPPVVRRRREKKYSDLVSIPPFSNVDM
jgi:hypothetical protein